MSARRLRSHKKFGDDVEEEAHIEDKVEAVTNESESEDSDDAPEEESMSSGKEKLTAKIEAERATIQEIERKQKEKRRLLEQRNQEQAKSRKLKLEEKDTETPDLLPEGLLDNYEAEEETEKPKKIVFDDEEAEMSREELTKLKLKQARSMNKKIIKKGPVRVQVLSKNKSVLNVPVSSIGSKKDKWLNRKAIKRR
ncbi:hypothetical protein OGAPHI_004852 [Ogataea philodendri]|uniref:Uncharacterized protein n=1 Tax=Ogataea philodendri TaxID=1378263 RepID=A0A9P8P245_9ASCO|nr:uncharacterized protein OGAPHI_004852 [Ogataea philodendri]KAH3664138.1 hypothetical protein OGAPHI_004852 [Ogataea philodendri]